MTRKNAFIALIMAILLQPSLSFSLSTPDTGQTKCYDNSGEISCPQEGEPFYGQDGSYTINPPSYTKLDASGNDLPDDASVWTMVRDNVTGLIWEVKNNKDGVQDYSNPRDADNTYTWYDSNPETNGGNAGTPGDGTDTEDYINALNAADYGGYSEWCMPTIKEIHNIANYGIYNPAIDTAYFPNTLINYYWSSTTSAINSGTADIIEFGSGINDDIDVKSYHWYARAVRGGQSGSMNNSFIDNGDGTITDTATGLMWQKQDDDSTRAWESAITYCEGLSLSGYDDWRLPNIKELNSIVDVSRNNPAIDPVFSNTKTSSYWSSTTNASNMSLALIEDFYWAFVNQSSKSGSYYVRAVRGGQIWSLDHLFITAPKQGDVWNKGETKTIKWETRGISGNVNIMLSRDGGKTFSETLVSSTPNDGSFEWMVNGAASYNCVLKIIPLNDANKATSQGQFTICNPLPQTERNALIALYNSTDGDNWTDNSGWKDEPLEEDGFAMAGTEKSWHGITCNKINTAVLEIHLANNQLTGSIPPEIGDLTKLRSADLQGNHLTRAIPTQGNLSNLIFLYLNNNQLTGSIPPGIGSLTNLQWLDLSNNQFTGSIPPELGNLSDLRYANLSSNRLTGSIPTRANLINLMYLYLNDNQLTGSIPSGLGSLNNLQELLLDNNKLIGRIPVELMDLTNLTNIGICNNHLYATDPDLREFLNNFQPGWEECQTPPFAKSMPWLLLLLE